MTLSECKVCHRSTQVLMVTWKRINGVLLRCSECVS